MGQLRTYTSTRLWKCAEEQALAKGAGDAWNRLSSTYKMLWDRSCTIAQAIAAEVPALTLHDEEHFLSLWHIADLISGPEYSIEPVEVFALGVGICIHDLAHVSAVYRDGYDGLTSTPEWRSAVLDVLDLPHHAAIPSDDALREPPEKIRKIVLFRTLRALHAREAEHVLTRPFGQAERATWLLDDGELRAHMAEILGQIAASHHWDAGELRRRLGGARGPSAALVGLGTMNPIKVACLLRTADACQIDQSRADDFSMDLHSPHGESAKHWIAQNRVAFPFIDKNQLVYSSTRSFPPEEADAWWQAYSLISNAERELASTDAVLQDCGLPRFQSRSVAGADSPAHLSAFIKTERWRPIDTSLRISDPKRVIEMLGGKALYGDSPWVPMRELLQNAADAIDCRRLYEKYFTGSIVVKTRDATIGVDLEGRWVDVFDDGIGMSGAIMSTALVDFGRSLKRGGSLREEYGFLEGKRLRPRGRHGIGLFSVLMISNYVTVLSRRPDWSHDTCRLLRFSWGDRKMPLLLDGDSQDLQGMSTRISMFQVPDRRGRLPLGRQLSRSLARIAPCLDCDITLQEGQESEVVHSRLWHEEEASAWLSRVGSGRVAPRPRARRIRPRGLVVVYDESGAPIGRASLRTGSEDPWEGRFVERGLAVESRRGRDLALSQKSEHEDQATRILDSGIFYGVLPVSTIDASRELFRSLLSTQQLTKWAKESLDKILASGFDSSTDDELASAAFACGGDPYSVALFEHEEENLETQDLLKRIQESPSGCRLILRDTYGTNMKHALVIETRSGLADSVEERAQEHDPYEPVRITFDLDELDVVNGAVFAVCPGKSQLSSRDGDLDYLSVTDSEPRNLLCCLRRRAEELKLDLDISIIPNVTVASMTVSRGEEDEEYEEVRSVAVLTVRA